MTRPEPRKTRTYKCEDELYEAAMARALELGVRGGLSVVIRDFLEEWVREPLPAEVPESVPSG